MKLSVNVPTYNEESNIKGFIENVLKVADEIILIDNSKDKTVSIAKKMSNKVKVIKFGVKDFSRIRNEGINSVKDGWHILYLDTDEFLSDELIEEIKNIKKLKNPADAYLVRRKNFFNYEGGSKACLTTRFIRGEPKIFKKGVIKFVNKTHEKAVFIKEGIIIKELNGATLHYPKTGKYDKYGKYLIMNIEDIIEKKKFWSNLLMLIKQLIKYILIFDYHPKYFKGNVRLWFETVNHTVDIIYIYTMMKHFKKNYSY